MKKQKMQPQGVRKIHCPKCGELMVKVYPWANLNVVGDIKPCIKCINSSLKSGVA